MNDQIFLTDVTPRDSLQSLNKIIPTDKKIKLINYLLEAKLDEVEVTSFAHPNKVPTLSDASLLLKSFSNLNLFRVLVLNKNGIKKAIEHNVKRVTVFASLDNDFSKENLGKELDIHYRELEDIFDIAALEGLDIKVSFSMVFNKCKSDDIPLKNLEKLLFLLEKKSLSKIILADTSSACTYEKLKYLLKEFSSQYELSLHLHSQAGKELDFIEMGLKNGVRRFETSLFGGGCPFFKGAQSNASTKDVLILSKKLGFQSQIKLDSLEVAEQFLMGLI